MICSGKGNVSHLDFRIAESANASQYYESYLSMISDHEGHRLPYVEFLLFVFHNVRCRFVEMDNEKNEVGNYQNIYHLVHNDMADMPFFPAAVFSKITYRFSNPVNTIPLALFSKFKKPTPISGSSSMAVYDTKVWLIMGLTLWCVSWISSRIGERTFLIELLQNFGVLLLKEETRQHSKISEHFLLRFWTIGAFFFTYSYLALLPSDFILMKDCTLNSLEDLYATNLTLFLRNNSTALRYISEHAYDEQREDRSRALIKTDILKLKEIDIAADQISNGKAALLDTVATIHGIFELLNLNDSSTKFYIGKERYLPIYTAYFLNKKMATWKLEALNTRIARFVETAQETRPFLEFFKEHRDFIVEEVHVEVTFSKMDLEDVKVALVIWLVCISVATLAFTLETIVFKCSVT